MTSTLSCPVPYEKETIIKSDSKQRMMSWWNWTESVSTSTKFRQVPLFMGFKKIGLDILRSLYFYLSMLLVWELYHCKFLILFSLFFCFCFVFALFLFACLFVCFCLSIIINQWASWYLLILLLLCNCENGVHSNSNPRLSADFIKKGRKCILTNSQEYYSYL